MSFSEKLKMIMEKKKMSCRDIAIAMCNYGSTTDLWNAKENKEKRSRIRKIEKWRSGTTPRNVSDIETLCKVLDCDFSYFFNDEPIENFNNKKAADFLGLDTEAISRIKNYSNYEKLFLSSLIRAEEFHKGYGDILQQIIHILGLHADDSSHTTITIENSALEEKTILKGGDTLDHILNISKDRMETVLLKVTDMGIKINRIRYENVMERKTKEVEAEKERLIKESIELVGEEEYYKIHPEYKK